MKQEIELSEMIKKCFNKKSILIVTLCLLISILLAVLYTKYIVKSEYKTTTKILINSGDTSIADFLPNKETVQDTADILNVEYETVGNAIITTFDATKKVITISAITDDPDQSYDIILKYVENLKIKLQDIYAITKYETIVNPVKASNPSNLNYRGNIVKAIAIVMLIYAIYIFKKYIEISNEKDEITENYVQGKINILGKIEEEPKEYRVNKYITTSEIQKENITRILVNLEFNKTVKEPKVILISNIQAYKDIKYVTVNLAIAYAKLNKIVTIIDTNKNSGIEKELAEAKEIDKEKIKIKEITNFIPTNKKTKQLREEIRNSIKEDEVVLIIGGDFINQPELIAWTHIADGVALIGNRETLTQTNLETVQKYLDNIDGNLLGVILNDCKFERRLQVTKKK